jgi:hypothetical protein
MRLLPASVHHWPYSMTIALSILIALVGCQSPALTAAPITEIPGTPSPEVSATQEATPIRVEATPSPEMAEPATLPAPTPTLKSPPYTIAEFPTTEKGPWLLFVAREPDPGNPCFGGSKHLWAMNQDGTWLTKLVREPVSHFAVQPTGTSHGEAAVAYVTGTGEYQDFDYQLHILELPSGRKTTITQSWENGLEWSPGGSMLAFVGTRDNDEGDIYIFDYAGGSTIRLSDHTGETSILSWSPDGAYLVYQVDEEIWSVKSDGSNPLLLFEQSEEAGFLDFYGWLDEGKLLFLDTLYTHPEHTGTIRVVYVDTGDSTPILDEPYGDVAFSKEHNTWLLTPSDDIDTSLTMYQYGQRTEIPGHGIGRIWWSSEHGVFFGAGADGALYTITLNGETTKLTRFSQAFYSFSQTFYSFTPSPDGKWWSWSLVSGIYNIGAGAAWSEPIFNKIGVNSTWSPNSQYFMILNEDGLDIMQPPDFQTVRNLPYVCSDTSYQGWELWYAAWIP